MTPHHIDQAKRNKRLAWIHVGIALLVLAINQAEPLFALGRWDDAPDGPQVLHGSVPFAAEGVSVDAAAGVLASPLAFVTWSPARGPSVAPRPSAMAAGRCWPSCPCRVMWTWCWPAS